jgi:hypothetical protein
MDTRIAVEYDTEKDAYSVKARRAIPTGTLVLLEHVLSTSPELALYAILTDKSLFKTLYPRTDTPLDTMPLGERLGYAAMKLEMNAYGFDGLHTIGSVFSKFNHSCVPNCRMIPADRPVLEIASGLVNVPVFGMWTHRAIAAGEELVTDYITAPGDQFRPDLHDSQCAKYGVTCTTCTPESLVQSSKKAGIVTHLVESFRTRDTRLIETKVNAYFRSDACKPVMVTQAMMYRGWFRMLGCVVSMSSHVVNSPASVPQKDVDDLARQVASALRQW